MCVNWEHVKAGMLFFFITTQIGNPCVIVLDGGQGCFLFNVEEIMIRETDKINNTLNVQVRKKFKHLLGINILYIRYRYSYVLHT